MSTTSEPTGIHTLPPEILSSAFETIIYTSGADISLILPLTLVCRAWHDVITHTPRLWGILTLDRATQPSALSRCIVRAKASPLSITADTNVQFRGGEKAKFTKQIRELASLVENWEVLDVGVDFLAAACELDRNRDRERERDEGIELGGEPSLGWVDMCQSVHDITLAKGRPDHKTPGAFFSHGGDAHTIQHKTRNAKLHSFTSISLSKAWILGFLGPNIKNLRLLRGEKAAVRWLAASTSPHDLITVEDVWNMLSRVPNAESIELERTVRFTSRPPPPSAPGIIHLPHLRNLTLRSVLYTPLIFSAISAPALQTLSIDRTLDAFDNLPLAPQWTQPGFNLERLHTLELVNCLKVGEVPYLIRWLWKMKALVRLIIVSEGDEWEEEGDEETDLFKALASPRIQELKQGKNQAWLCPSLMILRVDLTDTPIESLTAIARARGGIAPYPFAHIAPPPSRLRTIDTRLCAAAEQVDIDMFKSLVDNPSCICTSCGLHA